MKEKGGGSLPTEDEGHSQKKKVPCVVSSQRGRTFISERKGGTLLERTERRK